MSSRAPDEQGGGLSAKPDDAAAGGSFEESVRRLATIVEQLEAGDLPLERSLELFEEGVRLARAAQERLDRAERRVEELLGMDAQGRPVLRALAGT
ncbi:MAG TPA: exodeoxyribonuclease VII small subunit [Polyangiaceae bacterium]|jgi:exodeoxyribonuclease VII small subunit|nr:exodeoxyribonuclease VII small subunit [Polyangiaceae bacterium]